MNEIQNADALARRLVLTAYILKTGGVFVDVSGTSFQGEVEADYYAIRKLFWEPTLGDGYKVDAQWKIKFSDGTIATIYNWKNGRSYIGRHGTATTKIIHWHVGGFSPRAFELVKAHLEYV